MQAIIFCGAQGSGKSTFYIKNFFNSHMRISLDLFRTRKRESLFLEAALKANQRFVIDNTNPTRSDRAKYITLAKAHHFTITVYYFACPFADLVARNNLRQGKAKVPELAIKATLAKMERPSLDEGFDAMFHVSVENQQFIVSEWINEI